jgi:hypothetical protein
MQHYLIVLSSFPLGARVTTAHYQHSVTNDGVSTALSLTLPSHCSAAQSKQATAYHDKWSIACRDTLAQETRQLLYNTA